MTLNPVSRHRGALPSSRRIGIVLCGLAPQKVSAKLDPVVKLLATIVAASGGKPLQVIEMANIDVLAGGLMMQELPHIRYNGKVAKFTLVAERQGSRAELLLTERG